MDTRDIVTQLDQEIERLQKARSYLTDSSDTSVAPISRRGGRRVGAGRPRKIRLETSTTPKVYAEPTVKAMVRDRELVEK